MVLKIIYIINTLFHVWTYVSDYVLGYVLKFQFQINSFPRESDCLIKPAEFPASDHAHRIDLAHRLPVWGGCEVPAASKELRMGSVLSITKQLPTFQPPSLVGAPTLKPLVSHPRMGSFYSEVFLPPLLRNSALATEFQPPHHRQPLQALSVHSTVTHQPPSYFLCSNGATC